MRALFVVVWLVAVAAIVDACGSPAASADATVDPGQVIPIRRLATLEALLGPWQPVPFQLDAGFRAHAATACARDMQVNPGPAVVTIDARGAGVVIVRVRGAQLAVCNALQVLPNGDLTGAGGGMSGPGAEPGPPGDVELAQIEANAVEGGDLKVTGWGVMGRAGSALSTVIVKPAEGGVVVATLENGWFAAWWPVQLPIDNGLGRGPRPGPKFVIEGYDATGVLRAKVPQ